MDLYKYLAPMKNIPERFSNLAFWRGVRKLKDEVVNAFEYVDSWGDLVETNLTSLESIVSRLTSSLSTVGELASKANSRIDRAFSVQNVNINSNVSPTIYPYSVTVSQVPYPRVEQCIMRFDGLSTSGITSKDIIESAYFTGILTADGNRIEFTQPIPVLPLYNSSSISFISLPVSFYKTSSSMSISNVSITIKVRCRRIP